MEEKGISGGKREVEEKGISTFSALTSLAPTPPWRKKGREEKGREEKGIRGGKRDKYI
jgi:hypothetical protein